jgi:hypothetical protein
MGVMTNRPTLIVALAAATVSVLANAGPDIDEATSSRPDAGSTPPSSRQVVGLNAAGTNTLARVSGRLSVSSTSTSFVAAPIDSVDMFTFEVQEPADFEAGVAVSTPFETSLWLFYLKPLGGGQYEARPVAGNNAKDVGASYSQVTFPPNSTKYEFGTYAIAITLRGVRPFGYDASGLPTELFENPAPDQTGLMLPFATDSVLKIWGGEVTGGGDYGVQLTGATFIPVTSGAGICGSQLAGTCFEAHSQSQGCNDIDCCTLVCGLDAFCCSVQWDSQCAQLALQNCVMLECPTDACPADLNDDGSVNGADLGDLLSRWGSCY